MIVGKAIYHLLTNATAITDIVGTRIYPEVAQQDGDLPYIVYNITNNEPSDTKPEPSKLDTAGVEVNCYATSYSQAIDIAVAVRGALDRVKGTYNGVNVQSIQYINEVIDFDEPQRAYNISADYEVRISRTDFEIAQGTPVTGTQLGQLSDVNVTGVTDNQILSYDAASGTWVPAADAGGAENIDDLDDVNAGSPNNNDVLKFNSSTSKWTPVDWLSVLYAQLKQGSDATITNGSLSDSSLELTSTQAKLKAGITGLDITETSPGTIEIIVATDATGSTEFTALTLEGLTTSEKARFTVNNGTSFYIRGTSDYHNQLRGNSGITSSKVNMLPASDGLLALDADIPSTTDDLTEGSTNIYYTEARVSANTDVAANTAKVGVIAGGTTGQALVKTSGTDYDVEWADIAVDVQYHDRYATESETLRAGGAETIELYYSAQADGDGLAQSAQTDTPTAGYDIRRKLYYSEAGFADPDTGTWTQFAAIADNTTFANAKAALLAYLKERTGGTVPISLKMTWEEVAEAPSFTGLLNETYGSGAAAAYSVRRLNGNYTGAAIEVERSSDNTTQDIGFDSNGDLDESALTTFCTGTTCKVRTWYDQSVTGGTGSGNDAQQTDHTKQPTIYTGGAIVKEAGQAAVSFDGTSTYLTFSNFDFASGISAFNIYALNSSPTTSEFWHSYFVKNTAGTNVFGLEFSGNTSYDTKGSIIGNKAVPNDTVLVNTNQHLNTNIYDGAGTAATDVLMWEDGQSLSLTGVQNWNAIGGDSAIGWWTNGGATQYFDGKHQELIFYASDKSTDRTSIESNIGDYFTQNTPLLDTYTGAAAAYSLRKLRTAYSGSAIRVRRSSDNTEQDIGFNVFGELDTVSLASFCSGTDGFVKTWYDQSGNSNDATQTTAANQPKIYDSSTGVVTENGKPAVEFDGSDDVLSGSSINPTNNLTILTVYNCSTANTFNTLFGQGRGFIGTTETITDFSFGLNGNNVQPDIQNTNLSAVIGLSASTTRNKQELGELYYSRNATAYVYVDGSLGDSAATPDYPIRDAHVLAIGAATFTPNAKIQEAIVYNSDQSTNRTNIESNINTFYSIY